MIPVFVEAVEQRPLRVPKEVHRVIPEVVPDQGVGVVLTDLLHHGFESAVVQLREETLAVCIEMGVVFEVLSGV